MSGGLQCTISTMNLSSSTVYCHEASTISSRNSPVACYKLCTCENTQQSLWIAFNGCCHFPHIFNNHCHISSHYAIITTEFTTTFFSGWCHTFSYSSVTATAFPSWIQGDHISVHIMNSTPT